MGGFQTFWSSVEPLLDNHFGEAFGIEPKAKPSGDVNGRSIADMGRGAQDFVGIWSDPHEVVSPMNRTGHPAGEGARFSDSKPSVDFTTAALPYAVKVGDVITRRFDGRRYTISTVGQDGFTRSSITLTGK